MNRVSLFLICCRLLAIHICIPFYEITESFERKQKTFAEMLLKVSLATILTKTIICFGNCQIALQ